MQQVGRGLRRVNDDSLVDRVIRRDSLIVLHAPAAWLSVHLQRLIVGIAHKRGTFVQTGARSHTLMTSPISLAIEEV